MILLIDRAVGGGGPGGKGFEVEVFFSYGLGTKCADLPLH